MRLHTEIVFCYQDCSDREKLLKFEAEGREFAKSLEITRKMYSDSQNNVW